MANYTSASPMLGNKLSRSQHIRKEAPKQIFLLVSSALLIIYGIVFYYIPLVGWLTAFQNYQPAKGIFGSEWIGFAKFKFLFDDKTFWQDLRNTIAMGVINLVLSFVTAIGFALLLNEVRSMLAKRFIQTISYMPHFLSMIIVTAIVHDALSSEGAVNELLMSLKWVDQAIPFFSIKGYFWWIVAFTNIWKETGWNAIIYLAAITSIDPSLYEAADIDGAGRFQKMWYITLPSLKPTIIILLIINVGNVLNAGFELQYILGNDVIRSVSDTIDIYVLRWGIKQFDFSLGTAAGIFKSAVSIILVVLSNQVSKWAGEEKLF
ncbi:MAG: sugar ABC transporter permease [Clostridiales bacterium]|nr:sugar ABC transporter permease [Clostridiales bacterium]